MLNTLINALISFLYKPILEIINNNIMLTSINQVFFIEKSTGISSKVITGLQGVITAFAISLLTLKLLKKLFDIYIVSTDGDDTVSPIVYVKSFAKGIVIILCFTIFYGWLADIVKDFTAKLLKVFSNNSGKDGIWDKLAGVIFNVGSITAVLLVVFVIIFLILYIQLLMNGVRMLILRISIPLACTGLIDSNNGIYDLYLKKFFQTSATAVVQMVILQFSAMSVSNMQAGSVFEPTRFSVHLAIAIALLVYGLKAPQDLNEIFLMSAGSGAGSKAMHGLQAAAGFVRLLK